GAVGGGDAGGNAFRRLDGHGEVGGVAGAVVEHHQRQVELLAALLGQGQADQAAGVSGHEVDVFRAYLLGGNDEVAFVLAIPVIHQDDHFALANVFDDFFDAVQCHKVLPLCLVVGEAVLRQKFHG